MTIAIIPARAGSKRIKGKNIKSFAGKPLIAYSIEVALKSQLFSDVIVSTDSDEIASISREFGATKIIHRPERLADDMTGTSPVVRHAVQHYLADEGETDYVCCIYATAPFLQVEGLRQGLAALEGNPQAPYAFSVTSFPFPIQRALRIVDDGALPVDASQMGMRSQDLEECYHDAGQFYWGRTDAWLTGQPMFGGQSFPVILPRYLVQDIDTPEDWQRAELMYRAYVQEQPK